MSFTVVVNSFTGDTRHSFKYNFIDTRAATVQTVSELCPDTQSNCGRKMCLDQVEPSSRTRLTEERGGVAYSSIPKMMLKVSCSC